MVFESGMRLACPIGFPHHRLFLRQAHFGVLMQRIRPLKSVFMRRNTTSSRSYISLAAAMLLCFITSRGGAQQTSNDVLVTPTTGGISVQIVTATSLDSVLHSICKQSASRCEGLEKMSGMRVSA